VSRNRVALIVDHPLRDLAGMILLARELAERDVDVWLVPMCFQTREIFALAPDFVLLNYLRESNAGWVRSLHECGIAYGLLETEGGFYGDMNAYGRLFPRDDDLVKGLTVHCVWGERMAKWWREALSFDAGRLSLTGLPRFDWYAESMRHASLGLMPPTWQEKRQVVLFNTKVCIANPRHVSLAAEKAAYRKLGFSDVEIERHARLGAESIDGTVQLAAEVAGRYRDKVCVIRPHPHENGRTYEQRLQGADHGNLVRVEQEGTVTPWINQATVLIHRQCTTAVEAVLADRPAIAPQWIASSANAPDAESISFCPETRGDFNNLLSTALQGKLIPTAAMSQAKQRLIDDWLTVIDGFAAKRAAEAILGALPDKKKVNQDQCRKRYYEVFGAGLSRQLYRGVNQLAQAGFSFPKRKIDKYYKEYKTKEGKSFGIEDVEKVLRCLPGKKVQCQIAKNGLIGEHSAASIQVVP
jgi:surface carbohydrate biosynthesis protein